PRRPPAEDAELAIVVAHRLDPSGFEASRLAFASSPSRVAPLARGCNGPTPASGIVSLGRGGAPPPAPPPARSQIFRVFAGRSGAFVDEPLAHTLLESVHGSSTRGAVPSVVRRDTRRASLLGKPTRAIGPSRRRIPMLHWALIFFVIALIAA